MSGWWEFLIGEDMGRATEMAIWRSLQSIEHKLDVLIGGVQKAATKEQQMLDDLIAAVEEQGSAIDAVVAKIDQLVASGAITPEQQQQIADLAAKVRANSQRLADAVNR